MRNNSFIEFLDSGERNAWIREPGLNIYIRRTPPAFSRGDFDLANVNAISPGKGAMTHFLNEWEPKYQFYIENILQERLVFYFKRRGYALQPNYSMLEEGPVCMLGPDPHKRKRGMRPVK